MIIAILVAILLWLPVAEPGYRPRVRISREVLRETLASSFANYAVSLVLAIPLSIGSLIVLERHRAAQAGSFYILWMFGSLALAIPSAFGQSFLVEMMHRAEEGQQMQIPKRGLAIAALDASPAGDRSPLATSRPRPRRLRPPAGVAGLVTVIAGEIALPFFGAHYRALEGLPLVPFGLSALPGYLLYARMAQFRATHQNAALIVPPVAAVAIFVGSLFLPWGDVLDAPSASASSLPPVAAVTTTGWVWLGALTLGAALAFVERVRPSLSGPPPKNSSAGK